MIKGEGRELFQDPRQNLVIDARQLSSGTIGSLINDSRYVEIDRVRAEFVEFCEETAGRFSSWATAWQAFDKLRKKN